MKKIVLSLIGISLLSSCLKNEDNQEGGKVFNLLSSTKEVIKDLSQTQNDRVVNKNYHYGQFGNLIKVVENATNGTNPPTKNVYEHYYEGLLPSRTILFTDGRKMTETTYQFSNSGKLILKSEVPGEDIDNPETDQYEYNSDFLTKHTHIHRNGQTKYYTISNYEYVNNKIIKKTTTYTETNKQKENETNATYEYVVEANGTIKEVTEKDSRGILVISYTYDDKRNPLYLDNFHKITNPDYYLNEEYARYNITKEVRKYSDNSAPAFVTEYKNTYDKDNNLISKETIRDKVSVSIKTYSY